jgi:hypothetical protein
LISSANANTRDVPGKFCAILYDATNDRLHLHYYGAYGERIDLVRAWVWYSLAAKGGDTQATEKLTHLHAQLSRLARARFTSW